MSLPPPAEKPSAEKLPVAARPAASVLVLREAADGIDVLMGLRGASHRFMPNRLVFPGGAVDPGDYAASCRTPLAPDALRLLVKAADLALAAALGIAAARELEEETGLTLGRPPELDGLSYLCRAVTPESSPVRFDARFFVVWSTRIAGTIAGSGELEDVRYYALAEALALDLAFATRAVLDQLGHWLRATPAERSQRGHAPVLYNRAWSLE